MGPYESLVGNFATGTEELKSGLYDEEEGSCHRLVPLSKEVEKRDL